MKPDIAYRNGRSRSRLLAATALAGALLLGAALGAQAQQNDPIEQSLEQQPFFVELTELALSGDEAGLNARIEALADSDDYVKLYGLGRFFARRPTEHILPMPDYEKAIAYFEQALEVADVSAGRDARRHALRCKYEIARMLMRSRFDEASLVRARALLEEAGNQGLGQAALVLGQANVSGELGSVDQDAAEQWYRRALSLGVGSAAIELSSMLATADRPEARAEARDLALVGLAMLQREALEGDMGSAVDLGEAYTVHAVVQPNPAEAMRWLNFAAGRGEPDAFRTLAQLLATGQIGTPDPEQAGDYLLQAASLGSTQAALEVARARLRREGQSISVGDADAQLWLDRAVAVGNENALYVAASFAGQDGDFARQRALLVEAGALGSIDAMFELVDLYMSEGETEALRAVVDDLEVLAPRRPSAMVSLSMLKLADDPRSPLRDIEGGLALLEAAMERGSGEAMFELSLLYENGGVLPRDEAKAAALLQASVGARHLSGVLHLADLTARGDQDDDAQERVHQLLDQARAIAREEGSNGMLTIGRAFIYGIGDEDLHEEGIDWLDRAIALGNTRAMITLGNAMISAAAGEFNPDRAMTLYRRAVEAGDLTAHYQIGLAYATGMGQEIDFDAAMEHYEIAASAGSADAAAELGLAYASGVFVEKDAEAAYAWLRRAADAGNVQAMIYIANLVAMDGLSGLETGSAVEWMTRAANTGDIDAQFQLALTLQRGLIGDPDPDGALHWMEVAARNGHFQAQLELDRLQRRADEMGARDENG